MPIDGHILLIIVMIVLVVIFCLVYFNFNYNSQNGGGYNNVDIIEVYDLQLMPYQKAIIERSILNEASYPKVRTLWAEPKIKTKSKVRMDSIDALHPKVVVPVANQTLWTKSKFEDESQAPKSEGPRSASPPKFKPNLMKPYNYQRFNSLESEISNTQIIDDFKLPDAEDALDEDLLSEIIEESKTINVDDYAFKLDRIEGGDAYYKLVKLNASEKVKLYGGDSPAADESVEIEIGSEDPKENGDDFKLKDGQEKGVDKLKKAAESAPALQTSTSPQESTLLESQTSTPPQTSESTTQSPQTPQSPQTSESTPQSPQSQEVSSLVSNSFKSLSESSFNDINNLMVVSINGQMKTIAAEQLENLKKSVSSIKTSVMNLGKEIIKEITSYIADIVKSFTLAITNITSYISQIIANPISALVTWLKSPKTILSLGMTAFKVGVKNITNLVNLVKPYTFIMNMIYNSSEAFITILKTFYSAVIHAKIINAIKKAFDSIIKPFNDKNKMTNLMFLKPYISSLHNIISSFFELVTPTNLAKLLKDCLKIILGKDYESKKKKVKMSTEEIKRKVNSILDILKQYVSKFMKSISVFSDTFTKIFDNVGKMIAGNIPEYSVPEESLGKLNF